MCSDKGGKEVVRELTMVVAGTGGRGLKARQWKDMVENDMRMMGLEKQKVKGESLPAFCNTRQ